jgi:hypothetical protein
MSEEITSEVQNIDSTDGEGEASQEIEGEVIENTDEGVEESATEEVEESLPEEQPGDQLYKTIIDGQEYEVTLDELLGGYQRARSSNQRFQEASALSKRAAEERALLKEDPVKALKELGLEMGDIRELIYSHASKLLDEEEQENSLTPEQKRLREVEAENQRLREAEEERQREREEREKLEAQAEMERQIENEFIETLESESIEVTPHAIQRMATLMFNAAQNNYDMTTKEAAAYYREEQAEFLNNQLGGLSAEQLESLLGKEAIDQLRKHNISKIKNPAPKRDLPKEEKKQKPKKVSMEDFFG